MVLTESARYFEGFDWSILLKVLCSKVMTTFTSSIATAILYQALLVIYLYPNDDTETASFDRTVLIDSDGYVDNGGLRLSCPSEPAGKRLGLV